LSTLDASSSRESPAPRPAGSLHQLSQDELEDLARSLGLDPSPFRPRERLEAAVNERRHLISAMQIDAMLDVIKWGRRPVAPGLSREQLASEIVQIRSMRFEGLSERGLVVLAFLRGTDVKEGDNAASLLKKLRKQEGLLGWFARKRRQWMGRLVSNMLGETEAPAPESPPSSPSGALPPPGEPAAPPNGAGPSIQEEIEESGLFGGIASRLRRSADVYVNQKLDEIEARIDRKLDEIDRRLGEWRDKEVSNRLKILKITLWASVIVAAVSLIISWIRVAMQTAGK